MYSVSHIDQELAKRGINLDQISSLPPPEPAPQAKNINIDAIDAELARRGVNLNNTAEQPFSIGQRTGQLFHGMAQAAEAIPGAVTGLMARYSQPGSLSAGIEPAELETPEQEQVRQQGAETIQNALTTDLASKGVEKLAGRELTPSKEDTTGQFLHTTGAFLLPVPGSGYVKGAKLGVKGLGKVLAKEAGTAGGASAALQIPSFSEEGTIGRGVEDIAKMIIGGAAGRTLASKTIARDIEKLASQGRFKGKGDTGPPPGDLPPGGPPGGGSSGRPNIEVLNLAEKHGIDLPLNVGLGSSPLNYVANNYLKSIFTSRVYKDVIKNADEQMVGAVNKSIDSLGTSQLKPSEASKEFRRFLDADEAIMKVEKEKLYEKARSFLNPEKDAIVPSNTLASLQKVKSILDKTPSKGPGAKKIEVLVDDLLREWDGSENINLPASSQQYRQMLSKALSKKGIGIKKIDPQILDNQRKEINRIMGGRDPDLQGFQKFLSEFAYSIEKDLESVPNPEFNSALKEAKKFYRENIAQRFETDLARAIMHGEAPLEAYSKMDSVQNIEILEQVAGKSEKGKEILDALKRARLKEILETTMTSGGLERGSISTAHFGKLFSKGEKKQEVIRKLLPSQKVYDDLADIGKIAEEFSASGRDLLNTSGTSIAHADLSKGEAVIKEALKLLYNSAGAGMQTAAAYGAAGLPGAIIAAATPNIMSRLIANKTIVKKLRAYAVARSQGKEKYAETLLNRIIKDSIPLTKNIATVEISKNAVKIGRRPLTPEEGEKNE